MTLGKPFGYPIAYDSFMAFADPDHRPEYAPCEHDGHTYIRSEWWSLRSFQSIGLPRVDTPPCTPDAHSAFEQLAARDGWKPMDFVTPVLNKYPTTLWERTSTRHHLRTVPLVLIKSFRVTKGILQLASRLPNAEILPDGIGNFLPIRFTKGLLLIHPLPSHVTSPSKISLTFFQPK